MSQQQRYSGAERRQDKAHPWFNIHCLRGRRRHFRRIEDRRNPDLHADWHHPSLLYITLATLILCFADAHNTLALLSRGALETNLLMDALIHKDATLFIGIKLGLTAICLVVLVGYHQFPCFKHLRVRHVLYSVFAFYVGLIGYELAIWPDKGVPLLLIPSDYGVYSTMLINLAGH